MIELIEKIRELASERRLRITFHARKEMDADDVPTDALVQALALEAAEVIEDYPDDPRGHSHLVLSWLNLLEPIHICCAAHGDELVIITVYRPDTQEWTSNLRERL